MNAPDSDTEQLIAMVDDAIARADLPAAETLLLRICALDQADSDTWTMLGAVCGELGRLLDATEHFRHAITIDDNNVAAHHSLACVLHAQGALDDALHHLQRAVAIDPTYAEAHLALGRLLRHRGLLDESCICFHAAIAVNSDLYDAHYDLGNVLTERGRASEAVSCYRSAIELLPASAAAHAGLAIALQYMGKHAEAIDAFQAALRLSPKDGSADIHTNLSNSLRLTGRLDEAEDCLRHALRLNPNLAEAHNNLGSVLKAQGRMEEALECLQHALDLKADFAGALNNRLLNLNYLPSASREKIFRAHATWGQSIEQRVVPTHAFTNTPDPDRIVRIGYVSPDLRAHPVADFLHPILAHHDATRFHITCYAEVTKPDDVTATLRSLSHEWRVTCGLSDKQVTELIKNDSIDILVDLAGHTAHNRLGVFAARAAPIQISYLGYPNTTGLSRVDYRLTDAVADPPGSQQYYTEKLLYLQSGFSCYQPHKGAPAVFPLPAQRNGYVTFGSMSNLCKINEQTLDLWCDVLRTMPNARFLLYRHLLKGRARERIQRAFETRGIGNDRIILCGDVPVEYHNLPFGRRYYGFFEHIDIVLDTLPWNGHTTACEALWMGTPIVTLTSDRHAGRICASVLKATELSQLIADTPERFVHIAIELASDLERLDQLRSGLRERMRGSALCDGRAFTHLLEAAYRNIWQNWCANPASASRS